MALSQASALAAFRPEARKRLNVIIKLEKIQICQFIARNSFLSIGLKISLFTRFQGWKTRLSLINFVHNFENF